MHRGTPSSDAMRNIGITAALMSLFMSLQGLIINSETFFVLFLGFDLFTLFYFIGIVIALLVLYGIFRRSPRVEYFGLVMSTWFYTFLCLFLAGVLYFQTTIIVLCFGIAVINAILANYIKKG